MATQRSQQAACHGKSSYTPNASRSVFSLSPFFVRTGERVGGEGLSPRTEFAESSPHPQRIFDALRPLPARGRGEDADRLIDSKETAAEAANQKRALRQKLTINIQPQSDSGLFSR
jgi:hypothetical protein